MDIVHDLGRLYRLRSAFLPRRLLGPHYLLTWNCKHIANAATRGIIEETCREAGYEPPTICTPEELTED